VQNSPDEPFADGDFRRGRTARLGRRVLAAVSSGLLAAFACAPNPRPNAPAPAPLDRVRLAAEVRSELDRCWRSYEEHALGHDELRPVSGEPRDWYGEPLLITPVDALDSLLLAGLNEDAERARSLIVERLSFDRDISVKNFEITIRVLGGLLSGYEMTRDPRLLALARDLGRRLLPVFDSPTGMPYVNVNLKTGRTSGTHSNPAEIGTLILEFGTLSKLTGEPVFLDRARRAMLALDGRRSPIGLVGDEIDVETGEWLSRSSQVGGGIDSYFEYLLKARILFGDAELGRIWDENRRAIERYLADERFGGLWYGVSDMTTGGRTSAEFGALQAFFPAVLALDGDVDRAARLEDSCFRMWTKFGVEPDGIDYGTMDVTDAAYPLRPEIVESAYYLYRYTKDPRYLEMGRRFFEDLKTYCRVENGFTVLKDVRTKEKGDLMPSYFLAETLKYLYLLFSPGDVAGFDRVVFTTEAHPLRRSR
jgi:mannosidase alpha-like ER degradation enhancer 2